MKVDLILYFYIVLVVFLFDYLIFIKLIVFLSWYLLINMI